MAIGSAIERGSLICAYDERGTTLIAPSPCASARSSTTIGERGEMVFAKAA